MTRGASARPPSRGRRLEFRPLTLDTWPDLERLFGERGACGGCWCMAWRLSRSEYERRKGAGNKRAFKRIVQSDRPPGLLAYIADEPIGWCAIEPRDAYPVLDRSRTLKRLDDKPVWSVVCFFVAKPFRHRGVSIALLRAAVRHAKDQGARIVEGYPVEPGKSWPDAFAWTGPMTTFRKAGFVEVARRGSRAIVRLDVESSGT